MGNKVLPQLFKARHLTGQPIKPFTIVIKYFIYNENQEKQKKKEMWNFSLCLCFQILIG